MYMPSKWTSITSVIRFCGESALQILGDERQAQLFADWAVYLLVGYEQATLPPDKAALEWIVGQLLDALDGGRFRLRPAQLGIGLPRLAFRHA
ncbi:hypothetical protein IWGMT90018_47290 [Mycobacterium kiyosense]|nr:hypothetical protein IWGMT90018_47290 [Mycobacterium kiyosense]